MNVSGWQRAQANLLSARENTVMSTMSPSILHSAHEAKAKMDLENGSGEWLCCLKRLYFLRKAVAATNVLIGVLDANRSR